MRWPRGWPPEMLQILAGAPINCLISSEPGLSLANYRVLGELPGQLPQDVQLIEGIWPSVKISRTRDSAEAGPTGAPWIDANGWRIQLARARYPNQQLWIDYQPPGELPDLNSLLVAIAEACAFGARWIVTLPEQLAQGLLNHRGEALTLWEQAKKLMRFFQEHSQWCSWPVVAPLGVVSDFSGENEFLATEFLNLASRRNLAYRVILREQLTRERLAGLAALILIDGQAVEAKWSAPSWEFAEKGGLVIAPKLPKGSVPARTYAGHRIARFGRGRVAAPIEPWSDPYILAEQVHWLVGRRNDPVRLWNGELLATHCCRSGDGKTTVVHLIGYSGWRPFQDVTVGVSTRGVEARVWWVDGEAQIQGTRRQLGTEFALPPFRVYCAVECGGSHA